MYTWLLQSCNSWGGKKHIKNFTRFVFAGGAIEASEQLRLKVERGAPPFSAPWLFFVPPSPPLEQLPYSFQCQPFFKPDSTPLFIPQYKCPQ